MEMPSVFFAQNVSKSVIILTCTLLIMQISNAQDNAPRLYPGQAIWLSEHHFPIDDYQWNYPEVNAHLKLAIEKRSKSYLKFATVEWLKKNGASSYSGTELLIPSSQRTWLIEKKNIQIDYYDASIPEANALLAKTLLTRDWVNFIDVVGISTSALGVGLFGSAFFETLRGLGEVISFQPTTTYANRIDRRFRNGAILTLTGGAILLVNRLVGRGHIRKSLKRFSILWYKKLGKNRRR